MASNVSLYEQVDNRHESLIMGHMAMVKRVAIHLKARIPPLMDVDELVQVGMLGLIEAARGYDPRRGIPFEHFALSRVRGSMLDELRRISDLSRSAMAFNKNENAAAHKLVAELGRLPTQAELAESMGKDIAAFHKEQGNAWRAETYSIEEVAEEVMNIAGGAEDQPDVAVERAQLLQALAEAIQAIPLFTELCKSGFDLAIFSNVTGQHDLAAEFGGEFAAAVDLQGFHREREALQQGIEALRFALGIVGLDADLFRAVARRQQLGVGLGLHVGIVEAYRAAADRERLRHVRILGGRRLGRQLAESLRWPGALLHRGRVEELRFGVELCVQRCPAAVADNLLPRKHGLPALLRVDHLLHLPGVAILDRLSVRVVRVVGLVHHPLRELEPVAVRLAQKACVECHVITSEVSSRRTHSSPSACSASPGRRPASTAGPA
mgnify:CR=1 FL=1